MPRPFILPWLRHIYIYIYVAVLYNIQSPHHLAAGFCFCFLFFLVVAVELLRSFLQEE